MGRPFQAPTFMTLVLLQEILKISKKRKKVGNGLFNDALNTYMGVRHMVKDHSDENKESRDNSDLRWSPAIS